MMMAVEHELDGGVFHDRLQVLAPLESENIARIPRGQVWSQALGFDLFAPSLDVCPNGDHGIVVNGDDLEPARLILRAPLPHQRLSLLAAQEADVIGRAV
jgi:hypothetical protein